MTTWKIERKKNGVIIYYDHIKVKYLIFQPNYSTTRPPLSGPIGSRIKYVRTLLVWSLPNQKQNLERGIYLRKDRILTITIFDLRDERYYTFHGRGHVNRKTRHTSKYNHHTFLVFFTLKTKRLLKHYTPFIECMFIYF